MLPTVDVAGRAAHDAQRVLPADQRELLRAGLLPALTAVDGPVLDVGAGSGAMAAQVLAPLGARLVGVEPSGEMLAGLRKRPLALHAVQACATALPVPDACAAGVHAAYVLHHVEPPAGWQAALHEMVRVLRPGGAIALCLGKGAPEPGVPPELGSQVMDVLDDAHRRLGLPAHSPQQRTSLRDPQQVTDLLTEVGLDAPFGVVARFQTVTSVRELAQRQARNPFLWPAELTSGDRQRIHDAALPALASRLGDLGRPRRLPTRVPYAVHRLGADAITVLPAPVRSAVARPLVLAAQAELAARYGSGADGDLEPAPFVPPEGVFLLARRGALPVGCVGIKTSGPGVGEVKRLFVTAAGRRQRVGTRLLDAALSWARSVGMGEVRLETGTRQPEALALYRAQGWREIPAWSPAVDRGMSICFARRP